MNQEVSVSSKNSQTLPPPGETRPGRLGFVMIGVFLAAVLGWLALRVTTTVTAKQAIEVERAARPTVVNDVTDVTLAPLKKARWVTSAALEGTIEAKDRAELGFKVGGRLASVDVRVGDVVRPGQVLGRLDAGEAAAQLQAAQAQLEAARAQAALAADQGQRTEKLVKTGALAEATGVQATQTHALSEAQAKAASAQLNLARVSLSNHALVAPFGGVVTRAPTTRGAVVSPGQALFEIVDNSALRLKGTVNDADAALFGPGAKVIVETEAGQATGQVRTVVQVLDRVTRRVPVEVDLDPSPGLRVGSFVRASIQGEREVDVIVVPGSALRPGSQDALMVVEGDALQERSVRFAVDPQSGALLVRAGLAESDRVVLAPRPEAQAGDKVRVVSSPQADGAAPVVPHGNAATPSPGAAQAPSEKK